MSKNYNLKQENHSNSDQTFEQLSELKMTHKHNRRKNEILNGFVFMIGLVGFVVVFMLPRDGVYSNANLENSFSNSRRFTLALPHSLQRVFSLLSAFNQLFFALARLTLS